MVYILFFISFLSAGVAASGNSFSEPVSEKNVHCIMVLYGIMVVWYYGIMQCNVSYCTVLYCIVYKLCLPGDRPQGLFFHQKVHFLKFKSFVRLWVFPQGLFSPRESILGVLLYQRNEHIGTIGTK